MPIYAGKKYEAAHTDGFVLDFKCNKCGYNNRPGLLLFLLGAFVQLLLAAGILFFFAAGGLAMMIGLYWAYFHPRWAKADQRVIFMDPQD